MVGTGGEEPAIYFIGDPGSELRLGGREMKTVPPYGSVWSTGHGSGAAPTFFLGRVREAKARGVYTPPSPPKKTSFGGKGMKVHVKHNG